MGRTLLCVCASQPDAGPMAAVRLTGAKVFPQGGKAMRCSSHMPVAIAEIGGVYPAPALTGRDLQP